ALQDVFGYVNDVRLAPKLSDLHQQGECNIDTARAASYILGRHEAEAKHVWRQAAPAWKDLQRTPRFWQ
ncbi:MAG: inorganic triphosphatase, partial [Hyphomicrobiaceae bacterium]